MNRLSARSRIVIGQVCLLVSVLLTAMVLKIIPDSRQAVMAGRAKLCEAVAVNSSVLVSRDDIRRVEAILQVLVQRNDDILSAAIRRENGELVAEAGQHAKHWRPSATTADGAQVHVPIRANGERWGTVELRFQPLTQGMLWEIAHNPWTKLIIFVAAASYLIYFFYLGKMLQHLDPSKAVPSRVRSALNTLAEGLLVVDKQERIVLANQAFATIVGKPPDQLIGSRVTGLSWLANDGEESPPEYPWAEVIRKEASLDGVILGFRDCRCERRTFIVNCSPVLGHDGKCRGVLISLEDVTQLEETKTALEKSKDAAEEANRAKSDFLARMSHEIRTPMNAILGFTDVLRRGFDEDQAQRREYLETIHSSGKHLLDLINDILDLSKVESGKLEVELKRCSPYQLMSEVVGVLRVRADEKGISLDYGADGEVPETILTDPLRLRQTLMNLAGNAIKFTEQGGVKLVAKLVRSGDKPQLAVDVVDTGIGMPREALDKIFDPFVQADGSVTRKYGGTGLGLAISRQFAQALGGRITVDSELGKGTVFTVTVDAGPLENVRMLDAGKVAEFKQEGSGEEQDVVELPPARILVADDGAANRKLVSLVLRRAGAEVEGAENGQVAVDLAMANDFDLILMDMEMPVMDGYTATRTLREQGFTIPIIALTAHAMKGYEERCSAAGCSGFLTKPIDIDKLLRTLAKDLTHIPRRAASSPAVSVPTGQRAAKMSNGPAAAPPTVECTQTRLCESGGPPSLASIAPGSSPQSQGEPLVSSLPTDDPEFCEIVVEYIDRLREKLDAMDRAWREGDLDALAKLAHWLKGSGGTAGFDAFTAPAAQLQTLAKNGQSDQIRPLIVRLRALADRIVSPAFPPESSDPPARGAASPALASPPGAQGEPLVSSLPTDDPEFCEIVVEFIDRLHEKLDAMDRAWMEGDLDALAKLAHWLKGSGGTAGFDAFTAPAAQLETLAKNGQSDQIEPVAARLRGLADRIVAPEAVGPVGG